MQFTTIAPLADFPRDPQPSSTDFLKDVRDQVCDIAGLRNLDFPHQSASGHAYNRVGEYAACRSGTDMRGVTIIVRPSQVEIVAIERVQEDADTVRVVRCAKAYAPITAHSLWYDTELVHAVVSEAVRLLANMETV